MSPQVAKDVKQQISRAVNYDAAKTEVGKWTSAVKTMRESVRNFELETWIHVYPHVCLPAYLYTFAPERAMYLPACRQPSHRWQCPMT